MSKKEKVKTMLSFTQALILCLLATLFGIFGYTAVHYKEFDLVLGICVAGGILGLVIALYFVGQYFRKNLNKLEKMK